jgi:hypothetical protein
MEDRYIEGIFPREKGVVGEIFFQIGNRCFFLTGRFQGIKTLKKEALFSCWKKSI